MNPFEGTSKSTSIRVRTFKEVLDCFREHPEAKSADYQAEAEDDLTARNDAGNRVVANLLRDDSAGRAGSASAELGGVARLG